MWRVIGKRTRVIKLQGSRGFSSQIRNLTAQLQVGDEVHNFKVFDVSVDQSKFTNNRN